MGSQVEWFLRGLISLNSSLFSAHPSPCSFFLNSETTLFLFSFYCISVAPWTEGDCNCCFQSQSFSCLSKTQRLKSTLFSAPLLSTEPVPAPAPADWLLAIWSICDRSHLVLGLRGTNPQQHIRGSSWLLLVPLWAVLLFTNSLLSPHGQ